MKNRILIVYGGKSVEHDISIITALQAVKFLPKEYETTLVYIDKKGEWWTARNLQDINIYQDFSKLAEKPLRVTFLLGENLLLVEKRKKYLPLCRVESVLNCCHGRIGEDGCVSGVLETCEVAYTSSGVLSSAICMDKAIMKDILKANSIQTPEYVYFNKCTYDKAKILKKLNFPLIVKPANLGSSIGITACHNEQEFDDAVELAFQFDDKILVEKLVENLQEFNCACFCYRDEVFSSSVAEVTNKGEIFTFEDKYISEGNGVHEANKNLARKIKNLTEKVYGLFDCQGVVRVDYLYDEVSKVLYVNEINSIPGSLGFYLFKEVPFPELLNALLVQSRLEMEKKKELVRTFDSDALKIFGKIHKTSKK